MILSVASASILIIVEFSTALFSTLV
ncbi:uncharacterized protein METZ01_LOCUS222429, partial [marine metagenome]